jgi:hypothetical protein
VTGGWRRPYRGAVSWPPAPPGIRHRPGAPVVVTASDWAASQVIALVAVALPVATVGFLVTLANALDGSVAAALGAVGLGVLVVLIGLLPVLTLRRAFRPRRLIIEPAGVRWHDPAGTPWAVPWPELGAVAVSTALKIRKGGRSTTLVRLDLWPRDPGFDARHPEMREQWEASGARDCYRVGLGPRANALGPMDHALRSYPPPGLYRGVIDDGIAWGFRYT